MNIFNAFCKILVLMVTLFIHGIYSYPEQGKWDFEIVNNNEIEQSIIITKSLFNGSKISVNIICDSLTKNLEEDVLLNVTWYLRKASCWKEYYDSGPDGFGVDKAFEDRNRIGLQFVNASSTYVSSSKIVRCNGLNCYMSANDVNFNTASDVEAENQQRKAAAIVEKENDKVNKLGTLEDVIYRRKREQDGDSSQISDLSRVQTSLSSRSGTAYNKPLFIVPADGVYQLILGTKIKNGQKFVHNISYKATIHIEIYNDYGYLSAADYPLLIFYGTLCIIYVIYGVGWLIVSFMRWRELLGVQYWIGAVILLGMLEKAVFTAEYESVNKRGLSIPGLIVFAELVSCAKRTLSRMLVIIVSFGYGIVKPRLGIVLHRVVGVGILYFILASIEGCMRALQSKVHTEENTRRLLFAIIPLALLESAICWWVFSALVSTTRTLRLRRNVIKLNLFRHFTNTLIFAVGISIIFMLWSIKYRNFDSCLSDWKQLWVNDAFWHVLFAIILLVIMILWRPTNNNQRFAFSPLLDEGSEGEEDEQEKLMTNISDSMKQRNQRSSSSSSPRNSHSVEEDLKWMEENIPSMTDTGFPVMDSEEELVTTKFEISKMQ